MQGAGSTLAFAALVGAGLSWCVAMFFYVRTLSALSPADEHLRGQLFYNWLFASRKLSGEARENAGKVHLAMGAFLICTFAASGAFFFAAMPR